MTNAEIMANFWRGAPDWPVPGTVRVSDPPGYRLVALRELEPVHVDEVSSGGRREGHVQGLRSRGHRRRRHRRGGRPSLPAAGAVHVDDRERRRGERTDPELDCADIGA